jgi:hypothetical protein
MSFYDAIRVGASAAADYEVERSLRFNNDDSPRINRTPSSSGNRKTWTKSFWVKRGQLMRTFLTAYYISGTDVAAIEFTDTDVLSFYDFYNGYRLHLVTTQKFRDPSAWYHIVIALDTTQSTASDRAKIYVNGEQVTSFSTETYPSQNLDVSFNQNVLEAWGTEGTNQRLHFDGYMSEITYIDGLQLTPSSFGETNATTGQWVPIDTSELTYGTNGYRLQFADNSGTSATTLGKDTSGNGNNWTPVNFAVSDAMKDSPTNNFATMNPLNGYTGLSQGNLRFNSYNDSSGPRSVQATIALPKSGKWYWEARYQESGTGTVSTKYFAISQIQNTNGYLTAPYVYYGRTNIKNGTSSEDITNAQDWYNGTGVPAVLAIAVDVDNNSVEYFHNGSSQGTITLPTLTSSQEYFFTWANTSGGSSSSLNDTFNFGADSTFQGQVSSGGNTDANGIGDFKYAPPSGHLALCTANLPDPTIKLPNKHFDTLLYTGDGQNNRTVNGLSFQPDWLWLKARDATSDHGLWDAIRGVTKRLVSNNTNTEGTVPIGSFDNDGFTFATEMYYNANSSSHVAWCWNAGGSTVTNNDGSLSAQVRANTTAGFSIGTYTAQSSGSATVGHGLGVAPDVVITKSRTSASNWYSYHQAIGQDGWILLDSNGAATTGNSAVWNPAPTSSVFTYGSGLVNQGDIVFYAFSEVAGYSKFGSYTGNGNADGTFVYTGFRPAVVILKRTNSAAAWIIHDNKRAGFNQHNDYLQPDDNTAESDGSGGTLDLLSNGFKLRSTPGTHNGSGDTFIYLAFAESPFKNARAR